MLTYTLATVINDALGAELSNWDRFLLPFFFFWPFSINLLFLPAAHICFLHLHSCWKLLSISLFNPSSPFKHFLLSIFYLVHLILAQLLLCFLAAGRPHQTNSIIKVKSELQLWTLGFAPQGNLPSIEATVYTGRCYDTGKHHPAHMHMHIGEWMCTYEHLKQHMDLLHSSTDTF